MGRLVSTVSPDTGTTTYSYDSRGNPVTKSDAEGIAVTYDYDDLSRLTAINYPAYGSIGAWTASYLYDLRANGKGRLSNIITPNGPLYFDYDERGRLEQKKTKLNSLDYILTRTFTPAGRLTGLIYPISGRTVTFTRSTACECHVEEISTTFGGSTATILNNIAYRPFGSPNAVDFGSGGAVSNSHDLDGRVIGSNPARMYSYYSSGRLHTVNSFATPWVDRNYGYDGLGRLTSVVDGPFSDLSFVYDGVGNREGMWADGVLDTMYSYASGTNRLDAVVQGMDTTAYGYDQRGFATTVGTKTLVYNQAGQLTRAHEGGSNLGLYRYNGLNQRIRKEAGGVVTYYVYDFDGNLIQEALPDGTIQKEYIYWGGMRLAEVDVPTGSVFYFHNDHLGTPQVVTDANRSIVWEGIYLPFGQAVVSTSYTHTNNFRLPGQYFDSETGLHYNWHRYYDPSTGRYLTPDPIGLAGGINPYVYAGNDPVNGKDPSGLVVIVDDAAIIGLVTLTAVSVAYLESPAGQAALTQIGNDLRTVGYGIIAFQYWMMTQGGAGDSSNPNVTPGGACPNGDDERPERITNPKQDKALSKGEIKALKESGIDPHDLKPNSKYDLFKKADGEIVVKPKSGEGQGDPTGLNIKDFM